MGRVAVRNESVGAPEVTPVFCSLFAYAAYKKAGFDLTAELGKGTASEWPGFRTLAHLRALTDVALQVDGSTLIAKARSRQSAIFLQTGLPVWVSIDDDVYAGPDALAKLLEQAEMKPIVMAPYLPRTGGELPHFGGFGLVACRRDAIQTMVGHHPELLFADKESGLQPCGLFLETIREGTWVGEDWAFCERAQAAGIEPQNLFGAEVEHAGRPYRHRNRP
jgi:hypothetical protein